MTNLDITLSAYTLTYALWYKYRKTAPQECPVCEIVEQFEFVLQLGSWGMPPPQPETRKTFSNKKKCSKVTSEANHIVERCNS